MISFHADTGINRRLLAYYFKNKFVDKNDEDYEKIDNQTIFKKNKNIDNLFKKNGIKLAVFDIFLNECIKWYNENEITPPKEFKECKDELIQENDCFNSFIDYHLEITNNPADKVHKETLRKLFIEQFPNRKHITTQQLISSLKDHNLKYNYNVRCKETKLKGCFIGVKLKDKEEFINDNNEVDPLDDGVEELDNNNELQKQLQQLKEQMEQMKKENEKLKTINSKLSKRLKDKTKDQYKRTNKDTKEDDIKEVNNINEISNLLIKWD